MDEPMLIPEREIKSDKDWTNNKPKAKQMADSVEKMIKTIEQVLKINQANLDATTSNELKINKILGKQSDQSLKVYLFRRLVRIYLGERLCINDLISKLQALINFLNYLRLEMAWLWKTFYEDESIDRLISNETKMDILAYLQDIKASEVSIKVLTMQCICTHLFKQFEIVQLLFKDKYPDFQTGASMEDIHSWQQTIRKGSKRIAAEEDAQVQKSPSRGLQPGLKIESKPVTPRKQSDSRGSPTSKENSPIKSSKK